MGWNVESRWQWQKEPGVVLWSTSGTAGVSLRSDRRSLLHMGHTVKEQEELIGEPHSPAELVGTGISWFLHQLMGEWWQWSFPQLWHPVWKCGVENSFSELLPKLSNFTFPRRYIFRFISAICIASVFDLFLFSLKFLCYLASYCLLLSGKGLKIRIYLFICWKFTII